MNKNTVMASTGGLLNRWGRFLAGLTLLSAFAGFFMSGYAPPGVCGEVLRHNQTCDIDASPIIYTDVEHMPQLELGVLYMRQAAAAKGSDIGR